MTAALPELSAAVHASADSSEWTPDWDDFADFLSWRVGRDPAKPFLTYYDDASGERTELSYATFANWVWKSANFLREGLDVGRGDTVAVDLPDHWQAVVLCCALWTVGAAALPVGGAPEGSAPGLPRAAGVATAFVAEDRLEAWLGDRGPVRSPRHLVGVPLRPLAGRLGQVRPGVVDFAEEVPAYADQFVSGAPGQLEDVALAVAAGSPGDPTYALLAADNLLAAADAVSNGLGLTPDDRVLAGWPLDEVAGWVAGPLAALWCGGGVVLHGHLDPASLPRRLATEKVSTGTVTPELVRALVGADAWGTDLSRLANLVVPVAAEERLVRASVLDVPLRSSFGAPESAGVGWLSGADLPHVDLAVVRADGEPVAAEETGEVVIRGRTVMAGYLDDPGRTAEAFHGGWLHTGRRARWDGAGEDASLVLEAP